MSGASTMSGRSGSWLSTMPPSSRRIGSAMRRRRATYVSAIAKASVTKTSWIGPSSVGQRRDRRRRGARAMTRLAATGRRRAPGGARHSAMPGSCERLEVVGGLEAEDRAEEREARLQGAADRVGAAEPVALALEREVGVRDAVGREGRDDGLGLAGRHDPILEALEDEHRARDLVEVMDGRSLAIESRRPPDTARRADPGSATRTCACRGPGASRSPTPYRLMPAAKRVPEGQGGEGRVATGAAALDGQAVGVDVAAVHEIPRGRLAVVDVDDAPRAFEGPAVLAAVAGAAAVVDIDHRDAAARQQLDLQVERRCRRWRSGRHASTRRAAAAPRRGRRRPGSSAGRRARGRCGRRRSGT